MQEEERMAQLLSRCKIYRANGNAITEYALIGTLILLVAIGGLMMFGGNLNTWLGGVKTDMKSHSDQAALTQAKMQANAAAASLNNGTGLTASGSANNPALAQTTGANGKTLSSGGKGSANGSGNSNSSGQDAQLKALLVELANQAHKVAFLQSMLEEISKYSAGNINKFKSTTIYYEGQALNAWQLSWALQHGGEIADLDQKKDEVLASGASQDVKDTIAAMTDQVKAKAANTGSKTDEVLNNNTDPVAVDASTNSQDTHSDAATICTTGGSTDSGTNCAN